MRANGRDRVGLLTGDVSRNAEASFIAAKARRVEIVLESDESANRLTIDDDGIGVTDTTGEGRYGIVGMRERAAEACASFAIEALPVGGTRVKHTRALR